MYKGIIVIDIYYENQICVLYLCLRGDMRKRDEGAIREKVIRCGPYGKKAPFIEVEIYPNTEPFIKMPRRMKYTVSAPKQKTFNDKRAIRYLFQLIKTNFTSKDFRIDLSYSNKFKPRTEKEMLNMIRNYIERINRKRAKRGLKEADYICVNEYGKKNGRIHHHLLISGGLDRDEMEALWCDRKRKGKKEREPLGYANCDRLQFNQDGIEGLSIYITKDMRQEEVTEGQISIDDLLGIKKKGKRKWMQSKGLKKPWFTAPSDKEYSRKKVLEIVNRHAPDSQAVKSIFEHKYKGYCLDKCYYLWNENLGMWSISLRMHLKGHKP